MKELLKGRLVRLAAVDHEEMGKAYSSWNRDSELKRLSDSSAVRLHSSREDMALFEKDIEKPSEAQHYFCIRAIEDDRLLGDINLDVITVLEYNPRAISSYEKAGFRHEGRLRGALLKDCKRWDVLYMGILCDDWMKLNSS